jgi:Cd2+/Zn2+-exporting ATPase
MEKPGPWLWVEISLSIFLAAMLALSYAHALPEPAYAFIAGAALIGTVPVIWFALREALSGEWASMNMLASAALLFSLLAHEWASSAFIALMLSAARLLSILTEERTRRNIESLFALKPETAKVRRGAGLSTVPIAALSEGDEVVIEAGERVPVDGTVISGEAALDESSLTGESLPADKAPGSKVFTGTLVASGGLTVRTDKVGKDTTLEKIIALVESSREQRSKIYTVAETFGKTYLVLIFAFSGLLYAFTRNLDLVLSVVLVVCADDVAIAIPLAYLTAIGSSAKRGVIVKGSAHMEALGRIRTFVFDKTGTLTEGNLAVSAIIPATGSDEKTVLAYSALASRGSAHPLSRAVTALPKSKGYPISLRTRRT